MRDTGQNGPSRGAPPLPDEIAFLSRHGLDPALLRAAAATARAVGVTADRVLLNEGHLSSPAFYELLARHLGVPYMRGPLPAEPRLQLPLDRVAGAEAVRLAPNAAGLDYALAPRGEALALLLRQVAAGRRPGLDRAAVTTPQRLAALLRRSHRDAIASEASHALPDWNAGLSARAGLNAGQVALGLAAVAASAYGAWVAPGAAALALSLAASLVFAAMVGVRLAATLRSPAPHRAPVPRRPDGDLPVYTVVVPLYREARVVPRLVAALSRLDYPAAKLDIKVVVEADDRDTRAALERERLPERFEILMAPPGVPRTKPRALNVALRFAVGRYLVVYDAEDEPDPDQLRQAVARFEADDPDLGCLQGRLAIDNARDGWLSGLFALEYAALFDVINPGLARLGLPIPLGGTSNHFRLEALRAVNGWDAWNVTEDVDLGIRLARFGYRIDMLPCSTGEEAPNTVVAWINQRRRWHKGWVVTLMTHSRDLDRLFGDLGPARAVAILSILSGTVLTALFCPVFAAGLVVDAVFGPLLAPATNGDLVTSLLVAALAVSGLAGLTWPILLGMRRRGLGAQAGRIAFLPAYLLLACAATWLALFDFVRQPHAWIKTEHGTAKHRGAPV